MDEFRGPIRLGRAIACFALLCGATGQVVGGPPQSFRDLLADGWCQEPAPTTNGAASSPVLQLAPELQLGAETPIVIVRPQRQPLLVPPLEPRQESPTVESDVVPIAVSCPIAVTWLSPAGFAATYRPSDAELIDTVARVAEGHGTFGNVDVIEGLQLIGGSGLVGSSQGDRDSSAQRSTTGSTHASYDVLGAVNRPGRYPLKTATSMLAALATVDGERNAVDVRHVVMFRRELNERLIATEFGLRPGIWCSIDHAADEIWMREGDIVVVSDEPIEDFEQFTRRVFVEGVFGSIAVSGSYKVGQPAE